MTLPTPLVPAEVDLRDYARMPLDFERLFSSDTWVLGNPEEKVAALHLWCRSWHQVPAGSLPNDERILAHLSGSGPRWRKIRPHAMRGWVECTDGRLYHPVVAELALQAWDAKREKSKKGLRGASARWGKGNGPGMFSDGPRMPIEGKGSELKGNGNTTPPSPSFALPDWIKPEAWAGFEAMRKAIKKPMTDRARQLIVEDLAEMLKQGHDPNRALDISTKKNWQGVYAPKGDERAPARSGGLAAGNAEVARDWATNGGKDDKHGPH